jgi:hypothetical protein
MMLLLSSVKALKLPQLVITSLKFVMMVLLEQAP